jgi:hypothetical protein
MHHCERMEIQLATERLFLLDERMSPEHAEQLANERRGQAFNTGIGSLLQRPKMDDIHLIASQRRVEPLWHVAASATYVYERRREYTVPGSAPEVYAVTIEDKRYELDRAAANARAFQMVALEHCRDEFRSESYVDGMAGNPVADGPTIVNGPKLEIGDPQELAQSGTIVVPPEQRASFVVRKALAEVMKPVQADKILEESIALETTDLIYRPVRAYEFTWTGRDRSGVIEIDMVTGQFRQGRALSSQIRGMINRDVLFDVGADTVGLFVPGGSIAVKLAKAAIDSRK